MRRDERHRSLESDCCDDRQIDMAAIDQTARYDAFISYRHVDPDRRWAKWLHARLETYRVPRRFAAESGVPTRLRRVFRDEEEMPASANLSKEIDAALRQSRYLIVVCSPRTPESRWVCQEIEKFRELGRGDRILALLIEGEPGESFPRPLREICRIDALPGTGSTDRIEEIEPLAADVRAKRREAPRCLKRYAVMKCMAAILGCRLDDLARRDEERSRRRRTLVISLVIALATAFAGVAGFAIQEGVRARRALTESEFERYGAQVLLAQAYIEQGRLADARRLLEETDPALRHFEYDYLLGTIDPSARVWQLGAAPLAVWDGDDDGQPELIATAAGVQRADGSKLPWPSPVSKAEFFAEGRMAWAWSPDDWETRSRLLVADCEQGTIATIAAEFDGTRLTIDAIAPAVELDSIVTVVRRGDETHIAELDPAGGRWVLSKALEAVGCGGGGSSIHLTGSLHRSESGDELLIAGYSGGWPFRTHPVLYRRSTGEATCLFAGDTGITDRNWRGAAAGADHAVFTTDGDVLYSSGTSYGRYVSRSSEAETDPEYGWQEYVQLAMGKLPEVIEGLRSIPDSNLAVVWDRSGTLLVVVPTPEAAETGSVGSASIHHRFSSTAPITAVSPGRRGRWLYIGAEDGRLSVSRLQSDFDATMTIDIPAPDGSLVVNWNGTVRLGDDPCMLAIACEVQERSDRGGTVGLDEHAVDRRWILAEVDLASGEESLRPASWSSRPTGFLVGPASADWMDLHEDATNWYLWRPDLQQFIEVAAPTGAADFAFALNGQQAVSHEGLEFVLWTIEASGKREVTRLDAAGDVRLAGVGSITPMIAVWHPSRSRYSIEREGRTIWLPIISGRSGSRDGVGFSIDDARCALWLNDSTIGVFATATGTRVLSIEAPMAGGDAFDSPRFATDDSLLWHRRISGIVRGVIECDFSIQGWLRHPVGSGRSSGTDVPTAAGDP